MKIGFAILAHDQPEWLIELSHVLAAEGDRVVVHYDLKAAGFTKLEVSLSGWPNLAFARRVRCAWGEFSLVEATLNCLRKLKETPPAVDYVYLLSGADLSMRPLDELRRFLAANAGTQFIESVPLRERQWIRGGPREERFVYRHWFNGIDQKRLFKLSLKLQAGVGLKRRVPAGLDISLGSQFWCLSWPACAAILDLCEQRPDIVRFFRSVYIPDESFFQTLVRSVVPAASIAHTLTHYRFDAAGKPHVYGDDDTQGLLQQEGFFARKIAPDANALRQTLLRIAAQREIP